MTYSYINGIYEVTTPIAKGFKRFHSCNAQYSVTEDDRCINWDFVSYALPIMTIAYDKVSKQWAITICCDAFEQSRTTNRHIGRFLVEIQAPFSWRELRDVVNSGFAHKYDFEGNRVIHVRGEVNSLFANRFYN